MIIGVGVDVVDNERMDLALKRQPKLVHKILNNAEIDDLGIDIEANSFSVSTVESIAARFAVKEATSKALNVSLFKIGLHAIEILRNNKTGAPQVKVAGTYQENIEFLCSMSHSKQSSVAVVIAQRC